jgi:hypothetical protein
MLMIYVQIIGRLSVVRRIFWIRRKEFWGYFKVFPGIVIRTQKYQNEASVRRVGQPDKIDSNYMHVRTECNITSFEHPFYHEFKTNLILYKLTKCVLREYLHTNRNITYAFQYIKNTSCV